MPDVIIIKDAGVQGPPGPAGPAGAGFPYTGSAIITGSLVVTGSTISTQGFTGSLQGIAETSSINPLQNSILTNQTVGGITSGTTITLGTSVEAVLRQMLITYIAPTLTTPSLRNGGTTVLSSNTVREIGNSLIFNTASFTATADNPNGRFAYSSSFTASGADIGDFDYFFGNNILSTSNTLTVGGSKTINGTSIASGYSRVVSFSIRGINPETGAIIAPSARTLTYIYPIYYGMTATDYSTTGNINSSVGSGITKLLQERGTKTLPIVGTNQYVYFAYPAIYGNLTSIKDGNGFELIQDYIKYTRNQDGDSWNSISYNIYRSPTITSVNPSQNFIFTF
jgi:hypothetical protein